MSEWILCQEPDPKYQLISFNWLLEGELRLSLLMHGSTKREFNPYWEIARFIDNPQLARMLFREEYSILDEVIGDIENYGEHIDVYSQGHSLNSLRVFSRERRMQLPHGYQKAWKTVNNH